MAQDTMIVHAHAESMRREETEKRSLIRALLTGIEGSLRDTGTLSQRVLCACMMALLTGAKLPGGGYACQAAMFAVLLRQGFCVPAGFIGVLAGFVWSYRGVMALQCWQMPVCALLWLSTWLWAQRGRLWAAGVTAVCGLSAAVVTGVDSPMTWLMLSLSAIASAGLVVLYDGAALSICRRDELDGETRPLCVMAVCASLIGGLLKMPGGAILACAAACYLTIEHAYTGGAQQAFLCAGVLGGVAALGLHDLQILAMLVCGGFIAGQIQVSSRWISSLLMLAGMCAASALMGGEVERIRLLGYCLPGFCPFLLLSPLRRMGVTALVERTVHEEMTQSEAIAVRSASMIHAWAGLYRDTAQMMEGLCVGSDAQLLANRCISLLEKTSAAAHQVCERTLSAIKPDDEAYRRIRYALVRNGQEQVRVVYALQVGGRMEVMLLKPEAVAPISLQGIVTQGCGIKMRPCLREGLLSTQALFEQMPELDIEVGVATRSRSGEAVTGDSYISRILPGGRHVLALSDGMGSGVNALQESHAALHLLVESLRAGYTRAQALDMVNTLMLMCTGREMYATMDACVCDLHSGETAFEKLGACASYIVRSGEVRSVGADTLPVGMLPDVEAQTQRMTLEEGDVIVMMTDGVAEAFPGGEEALQAAVGKMAWLHPQAIGERLIAQVLEEGEAKDDMAVICARLRRPVAG